MTVVTASERTLAMLNDGERLLLWALRHRVATDDGSSPHLAHAFDVLCGTEIGPHARAALNALVAALDAHARRPLAFHGWCDRALTTDEADLLELAARLQAGRVVDTLLAALVTEAGTDRTRAAAARLVRALTQAGLHLRIGAFFEPSKGEPHVIHAHVTVH